MKKTVSLLSKPSATEAEQWVNPAEEPLPLKEPLKRLTVDIPEALHRKLKASCALRGVKLNEELRALLEEKYANQP